MKNNFFSNIPINQSSEIPLYRQIYASIRRAILLGNIHPGTKLPSTRSLSGHLNVSRNTVLSAYEQLLAEGCLVSEQGSGTYVAFNLESTKLKDPSEQGLKPERSVHSDRAIEMMSMLKRITKSMPACKDDKIRAFREGVPAIDMFPNKIWRQLIDKALRSCPPELLCGGNYLPSL